MANDYLLSKWKMWYKWFDVNHDGKTNMKDMEYERDKFLELHSFSEDKQSVAARNMENWWRDYLFWGQEEITEEEFVNFQNKAFAEDKAAFVERVKRCFYLIFDIAETGITNITEKEYLAVCVAAGHGNVELDKRFFHSYKPVDGRVPIKDLVDSWVVFLTCEDDTVPDVVKSAWESGV